MWTRQSITHLSYFQVASVGGRMFFGGFNRLVTTSTIEFPWILILSVQRHIVVLMDLQTWLDQQTWFGIQISFLRDFLR